MTRLSDNDYIRKILAGDTDCFAPLLERYSKQVFALAVRIVGNRLDAEEVTQDVFLKAFRSLSKFRGESSFSTWLYRIAYNVAVSTVRKQAIDILSIDESVCDNIPDEITDDDNAIVTDARINSLNCALDKLPPSDKAMLQMFYHDEKSMEDIAVIMQMTVTNVKTRIFRLRKKLYEMIKIMEDGR
ncbi:MAG: sigma-70 family RNA polymerase sigma factor [Tannerella sp.]|jgi:RNA polymerase sigma-70 factor (ECF subfamily)|nr:sigma-70 family RNA polymerase sigma factor [Tannerella sp.]